MLELLAFRLLLRNRDGGAHELFDDTLFYTRVIFDTVHR